MGTAQESTISPQSPTTIINVCQAENCIEQLVWEFIYNYKPRLWDVPPHKSIKSYPNHIQIILLVPNHCTLVVGIHTGLDTYINIRLANRITASRLAFKIRMELGGRLKYF